MARGKKRERENEGTPAKRVKSNHDFLTPDVKNTPGIVLTCGQNTMGQLGLGENIMERKKPAVINSVKNVVDIYAGGMHSLLLTSEGEVLSFGCNDEGALGRDTSESGSDFIPKKVQLPGNCVKMSAGDSHSATLLSDGRLFAWGTFRNTHGTMGLTQEGNKPLPLEICPGEKFCDIASGTDHLAMLSCSGKLYTVGSGEQGQLGRVSLRVGEGNSQRRKSLLLKPTIVFPRKKTLISAIWATPYCTYYKNIDSNDIYAFGLNNFNQLGIPKVGIITTPRLTKLQNVKKISGGIHHTLILTQNGEVYAIGRREYGRLGLGNVGTDAEEPILIKDLKGKFVIDICCGESVSFAVTDNGDIYAWGMGNNYQLGTGEEDDVLQPLLIKTKNIENRKAIKVSSGGQHSLFLIDNVLTDTNQKGDSEAIKENGNIEIMPINNVKNIKKPNSKKGHNKI